MVLVLGAVESGAGVIYCIEASLASLGAMLAPFSSCPGPLSVTRGCFDIFQLAAAAERPGDDKT